MSKTLLFAIDPTKEETIVSESAKGSYHVQQLERIPRQSNVMLYEAVSLLSSMAKASDFDAGTFKAMDKVCQLIYAKNTASGD